jgi:hypothetical protein
MNAEIIGVWITDQNDLVTKNTPGEVTMTFTKDGTLIYDIHDNGKLQRINLTYRINGDFIISDQPSHPQEQITRYRFDDANRLILEFDGQTSFFIRKTGA